MKSSNKDMDRILEEGKKAANFQSLSYLASWDQETYMPKDGINLKASIMSFLAQERHKVLTGKKLEGSLENLIKNPSSCSDEQIIVKRFYYDIKREQKLGKSFVKKFSIFENPFSFSFFKTSLV